MKKIIIILFLVLILGIGILIALPFFIPASYYREQVEKSASQALDREVKIHGKVGLSLFPPVSITAHKITVANATGFQNISMVKLGTMKANLKLWPLFQKKVEINEFILKNPEVYLQKNIKGQGNWVLGIKTKKNKSSTSTPKGFERRPNILPLKDIKLGRVSIHNGYLIYLDDQTKKRVEVKNINLSVGMPSLQKPLLLQGNFLYKDQPVETNLQLDSLKSFFDGKETPVSLKLETNMLKAKLDGKFLKSLSPDLSGHLSFSLPDLKQLAKEIEVSLPERKEIFNKLTFEGDLSGNSKEVKFSNISINLDAIKAYGSFQANWVQKNHPKFSTVLSVPTLDLTPYMKKALSSPSSQSITRKKEKAVSSEKQPEPAQIIWSQSPIDFSALNLIDGDLILTVDHLKAQKFIIDKAEIKAKLEKARLNLALNKLSLYEGQGTGNLILNTRQKTPSLSIKTELQNLNLNSFLENTIGFKKLTGKGAFSFSLISTGSSQKQIIENLNGNGNFSVNDGKILGINLGKIARTADSLFKDQDLGSILQKGLTTAISGSLSKNISPTESTDFSQMTGNLQVQNGVINNNDLSILMPYLRVFGKGNINIGKQNIDYRLSPTLINSAKGQGGQADKKGFNPVDLIVKGSWQDVNVSVDLDQIEKIAERKARKQLKKEGVKLIDQNLDKNTGNLIKNVLGLDKKKSEDTKTKDSKKLDSKNTKEKAKSLLKNIFGKE